VSGLRTRAARALVSLAALACGYTIACEKHEFEPPSRAQRVTAADTLLTPETFDTVSWPSDSARAFAGNNAYAAHCRGCHGYLGRGDTDYAREHRNAVPSLVRPDWPYPDLQAVRHRIFTGHPTGMPTWGVAGIAPREIDATAYYLLYVLRPEVLGTRR
jgi:mono/diheme cytochrome c family protein